MLGTNIEVEFPYTNYRAVDQALNLACFFRIGNLR